MMRFGRSESAELPPEEMVQLVPGADYGWPEGIVMSGRIWTPPDCKRVWQTLVQGSQLLTYIRLPYAA